MSTTPEKLRELAGRTYPFGLDVADYVRASRDALRQAADEIERLRGGHPTTYNSLAEVQGRLEAKP